MSSEKCNDLSEARIIQHANNAQNTHFSWSAINISGKKKNETLRNVGQVRAVPLYLHLQARLVALVSRK